MQRVVVGHLLTDDPEGRVLKRIVIGVMGLLLLGGGAGLARANPPANTPPLAANHGLCTANYNGLKNGWRNQLSGVPPAFQTNRTEYRMLTVTPMKIAAKMTLE